MMALVPPSIPWLWRRTDDDLLDFAVHADGNAHKGRRGRLDDLVVAGSLPVVARLGKEWVAVDPTDGFRWRQLTRAIGCNRAVAVDCAGQAGLGRDDRAGVGQRSDSQN